MFKIGENVKIKDVEELYNFLDFAIEEMNADIDEYYINGGDTDPSISEEGAFIEMLWIRPSVISSENITNILKTIEYLEKHANIEFSIVDVNVR